MSILVGMTDILSTKDTFAIFEVDTETHTELLLEMIHDDMIEDGDTNRVLALLELIFTFGALVVGWRRRSSFLLTLTGLISHVLYY